MRPVPSFCFGLMADVWTLLCSVSRTVMVGCSVLG